MPKRPVFVRRSALSAPSIAAWTIAGVAVALTVAEVWLASENGTGTPAQVVNLTLVLLAVVGAIVASRQPLDPIGWILCGIALLGGLGGFLWDYGYRVLVFGSASLPLGQLAFWIGSWIWVPAAGVGLPAILVRFPDGRVLPRWKGIDWLAVFGSMAVLFSIAAMPGLVDPKVNLINQFALEGADSWLVGLRWLGYAGLGAAFVGSVASLLVRLAHARGDEREQIKWIAAAAALVTAAVVYGLARQALEHENLFYSLIPFFVSTLAIPIAIGVAILKYRLYDIDLVINRTLVYGGLTAMLAGLYTFWVGLTQRLVVFSGQRSDLVILLTAFVGAAAFTPVKNWLQRTVDRKFAVRDAASVVDSMREQVELIVNVLDAERIARRLVDDSAVTYQASHASLALGTDRAVPFHTCGDPSTPTVLRIVLHSQGKEIGVLSLGERRRGAVYTNRDERALQLCADAVADAINLWEGALRQQLQGAAR